MSDLRQRLTNLETHYQPGRDGPPMLFVLVGEDWSEAERAALDGDDQTAKADTVERHTGERPGRRTKIIFFQEDENGPQ